jgi:hypothetical protein
MSDIKSTAPRWAGRVAKSKIVHIYENDAQGMHDEDLFNDVAYTLLTRCKSMLMVEEARQGRATCPVCEAMIEHTARKRGQLSCGNCDWKDTWNAYRASMDGLHLIGPGLQPFCHEYVKWLPKVKTPNEKMY